MRIVESAMNGRDLRVACGTCGAESVHELEWLRRSSRFRCPVCSSLMTSERAAIELFLQRLAASGARRHAIISQ